MGEFEKGILLINKIEKEIEQFKGKINKAKEIVLYHCFVVSYFGVGNYHKSLFWSNKILNDTGLQLRQDLHSAARMVNLIVHFELGNQELLESLVKSAYRFLYKGSRLYKFEIYILNFIKNKLPNIVTGQDQINIFQELKTAIIEVSKDPFEKEVLDYFDFISWLQRKIEDRPFAEIVKEKARPNESSVGKTRIG